MIEENGARPAIEPGIPILAITCYHYTAQSVSGGITNLNSPAQLLSIVIESTLCRFILFSCWFSMAPNFRPLLEGLPVPSLLNSAWKQRIAMDRLVRVLVIPLNLPLESAEGFDQN